MDKWKKEMHEKRDRKRRIIREIRHEYRDRLHREFHDDFHHDFHTYHRSLNMLRPVAFIINLFIMYLLFRYVGIKAITIFLALFFIIMETVQIFVLWRMEKRIFQPIQKLKKGVEQIAQGNYNVKIERDVCNEIGLLITSFNNMAQKLQESEHIQLAYEENRKTLIAHISHDLKTPITSISGYVEALLDDVVTSPEKRRTYLKTIHSNIAYINHLIDDLFLFSKLDMQRLNFNFEHVEIKPFMGDLIEEFKIDLEEQGVMCTYADHIKNSCMVYIDGKRINQAMRNIIGNAVKYGPEKGLKIDIALSRDQDGIRIEIKDNGSGIPEDKLPHIFDSFYRIDNERTKDLMSTGLGLSITKELIEAHKGKISAASVLGEGSTFVISLPTVDL